MTPGSFILVKKKSLNTSLFFYVGGGGGREKGRRGGEWRFIGSFWILESYHRCNHEERTSTAILRCKTNTAPSICEIGNPATLRDDIFFAVHLEYILLRFEVRPLYRKRKLYNPLINSSVRERRSEGAGRARRKSADNFNPTSS